MLSKQVQLVGQQNFFIGGIWSSGSKFFYIGIICKWIIWFSSHGRFFSPYS